MQKNIVSFLVFIILIAVSCNTGKSKEKEVVSFLTAKQVVQLNQLIYKDSITEAITKNAPDYEVVFKPHAIGGNYAIIVKNKNAEQYALVIRGSVIEFSNEGFQNFFMQDFNIFTLKPWGYADTVKGGFISQGTYTGFQNLLQLRDSETGLNIKEFVEQKIPASGTLVITGHSLGGNLAYPMAGYLKKELFADKKNNLQLITFGAPAAGNAAFVQDIEEKFPNAERYVMDKDIAPVFPDTEKISELARIIGLDSVLNVGELNFNGLNTKLDAGNLLDIASKILEKTNVINKTNKYVQSQKHLRVLICTDSVASNMPLSAEAIFGKAYRYHKIDAYAELLGGKQLE